MLVAGRRRAGAPGVTAKDIVLAIIGKIGTAGGTGHVIEYAGEAIRALDMAGRMTVCNMSIEAGARAGLIAPDDTTFAYVEGRPFAPQGEALRPRRRILAHAALRPRRALRHGRSSSTPPTSRPMVSWGTSPEAVLPITGTVPDPATVADEAARAQMRRMLDYMALQPGQTLTDIPVDVVFIGSCTNGRIEDIRAAAAVARGRTRGPRRARHGRPRQRHREAAGRGRGPRPHLPGRRLRVARGRVQHVPRHEPGQAHARPALRQHQQPQLRGPAGPRRAHPPAVPRHGRRRRGHRPVDRRAQPRQRPSGRGAADAGLHHPDRRSPPRCHWPTWTPTRSSRRGSSRPSSAPASASTCSTRCATTARARSGRTSCSTGSRTGMPRS